MKTHAALAPDNRGSSFASSDARGVARQADHLVRSVGVEWSTTCTFELRTGDRFTSTAGEAAVYCALYRRDLHLAGWQSNTLQLAVGGARNRRSAARRAKRNARKNQKKKELQLQRFQTEQQRQTDRVAAVDTQTAAAADTQTAAAAAAVAGPRSTLGEGVGGVGGEVGVHTGVADAPPPDPDPLRWGASHVPAKVGARHDPAAVSTPRVETVAGETRPLEDVSRHSNDEPAGGETTWVGGHTLEHTGQPASAEDFQLSHDSTNEIVNKITSAVSELLTRHMAGDRSTPTARLDTGDDERYERAVLAPPEATTAGTRPQVGVAHAILSHAADASAGRRTHENLPNSTSEAPEVPASPAAGLRAPQPSLPAQPGRAVPSYRCQATGEVPSRAAAEVGIAQVLSLGQRSQESPALADGTLGGPAEHAQELLGGRTVAPAMPANDRGHRRDPPPGSATTEPPHAAASGNVAAVAAESPALADETLGGPAEHAQELLGGRTVAPAMPANDCGHRRDPPPGSATTEPPLAAASGNVAAVAAESPALADETLGGPAEHAQELLGGRTVAPAMPANDCGHRRDPPPGSATTEPPHAAASGNIAAVAAFLAAAYAVDRMRPPAPDDESSDKGGRERPAPTHLEQAAAGIGLQADAARDTPSHAADADTGRWDHENLPGPTLRAPEGPASPAARLRASQRSLPAQPGHALLSYRCRAASVMPSRATVEAASAQVLDLGRRSQELPALADEHPPGAAQGVEKLTEGQGMTPRVRATAAGAGGPISADLEAVCLLDAVLAAHAAAAAALLAADSLAAAKAATPTAGVESTPPTPRGPSRSSPDRHGPEDGSQAARGQPEPADRLQLGFGRPVLNFCAENVSTSANAAASPPPPTGGVAAAGPAPEATAASIAADFHDVPGIAGALAGCNAAPLAAEPLATGLRAAAVQTPAAATTASPSVAAVAAAALMPEPTSTNSTVVADAASGIAGAPTESNAEPLTAEPLTAGLRAAAEQTPAAATMASPSVAMLAAAAPTPEPTAGSSMSVRCAASGIPGALAECDAAPLAAGPLAAGLRAAAVQAPAAATMASPSIAMLAAAAPTPEPTAGSSMSVRCAASGIPGALAECDAAPRAAGPLAAGLRAAAMQAPAAATMASPSVAMVAAAAPTPEPTAASSASVPDAASGIAGALAECDTAPRAAGPLTAGLRTTAGQTPAVTITASPSVATVAAAVPTPGPTTGSSATVADAASEVVDALVERYAATLAAELLTAGLRAAAVQLLPAATTASSSVAVVAAAAPVLGPMAGSSTTGPGAVSGVAGTLAEGLAATLAAELLTAGLRAAAVQLPPAVTPASPSITVATAAAPVPAPTTASNATSADADCDVADALASVDAATLAAELLAIGLRAAAAQLLPAAPMAPPSTVTVTAAAQALEPATGASPAGGSAAPDTPDALADVAAEVVATVLRLATWQHGSRSVAGVRYHCVEGGVLSAESLSMAEVVCHQTSCTATHAKGLAGDIFDRFPECDVYLRRVDGPASRSAAVEPGTIEVITAKTATARPATIAALHAQYWEGPPSHEGDTKSQRKRWFADCLRQLGQHCRRKKRWRVTFPWRIGCSSVQDGNWEAYMRMLSTFASEHPHLTVSVVADRSSQHSREADLFISTGEIARNKPAAAAKRPKHRKQPQPPWPVINDWPAPMTIHRRLPHRPGLGWGYEPGQRATLWYPRVPALQDRPVQLLRFPYNAEKRHQSCWAVRVLAEDDTTGDTHQGTTIAVETAWLQVLLPEAAAPTAAEWAAAWPEETVVDRLLEIADLQFRRSPTETPEERARVRTSRIALALRQRSPEENASNVDLAPRQPRRGTADAASSSDDDETALEPIAEEPGDVRRERAGPIPVFTEDTAARALQCAAGRMLRRLLGVLGAALLRGGTTIGTAVEDLDGDGLCDGGDGGPETCSIHLVKDRDDTAGPPEWLQLMSDCIRAADPSQAAALLERMPPPLRATLNSQELTFGSLFSGVGGRSAGYAMDDDGWRGFAVESMPHLVSVHRHNDKRTEVFQHEMTADTPLPASLQERDWQPLTHLSAGPPCQPYSQSGKGEGLQDPRDGMRAFLAAVRQLRPAVVECESVPNLLKFPGVLRMLHDALEEMGYHFWYYVLNAAHYGVPQARRRLFLVASIIGPLEAPAPTTRERPVTVGEAIGDGTPFEAFTTHHDGLALTDLQVMRADRVDVMAGCARPRVLHADKPARTLTASNLANLHALMIRLVMHDGTVVRPSVLQTARLQSFPADFTFPPDLITTRQAFMAIGNACPSELGRHLTAAARRQVEHARALYAALLVTAAGPPLAVPAEASTPAYDDSTTRVAIAAILPRAPGVSLRLSATSAGSVRCELRARDGGVGDTIARCEEASIAHRDPSCSHAGSVAGGAGGGASDGGRHSTPRHAAGAATIGATRAYTGPAGDRALADSQGERTTGLLGGARHDGQDARWVGLRGRKLCARGGRPPAVHEFCIIRRDATQDYAFYVQWDSDGAFSMTDLHPRKQVPPDSPFPVRHMGREQWQLNETPPVLLLGRRRHESGIGYCPRCFYPSDALTCPICFPPSPPAQDSAPPPSTTPGAPSTPAHAKAATPGGGAMALEDEDGRSTDAEDEDGRSTDADPTTNAGDEISLDGPSLSGTPRQAGTATAAGPEERAPGIAASNGRPQAPGLPRQRNTESGTRRATGERENAPQADADGESETRKPCGRPSPAVVTMMLAMAMADSKHTHDYGPGSPVTASMARHQLELRNEVRRRARVGVRSPRHMIAACGMSQTPEADGLTASRVRGVVEDGVNHGNPRDGPLTPAIATGVGYETKQGDIQKIEHAIYDSGAFDNFMDPVTADERMRNGNATGDMNAHVQRHLGVGGSVSTLGTCKMEMLFENTLTGSWVREMVCFRIIDCKSRLVLFGSPFFQERNADIKYRGDECWVQYFRGEGQHRKEVVTSASTANTAELEDLVAMVKSVTGPMDPEVTHPYVSTTKEYIIPGDGQGIGVEIEVPEMVYGCTVQILPLPDCETELFANKRRLRVHGPVLAKPDANGKINVILKGFGSQPTTLPAYTPVAQYVLDPTALPKSEHTADEILEQLKIPLLEFKSEEEAAALLATIKAALFKDRPVNQMCFTENRIGKGVGAPPAELHETEEFKRSGKPPPSQAARPVRGDQLKAQDEYKDTLIAQGKLVPSSSPYGAAVVMVPKGSGKGWRMAFDYTGTNAVLEKQHYGFKTVRGCTDALARSKFFTCLDMVAAFWQAPLHPNSRKYTAVNFPSGRYEYTSLPMGLQAASAVFQRNMDILLCGLQPLDCISFIDDVIIYGGETFEEHLVKVAKVLTRIGGAGYTLRASKTVLGAEYCQFLGSIIGQGTIRPDDSKISQIRDAEFPKDTEALHKWIGLIQWCGQHVPNLSQQLQPLQDRLRNHEATTPSTAERAAFESVKGWLTDPQGPVCALPDFDRPFYLLCDAASTVGAGVALVQKDDTGFERVVAYWSRIWQAAESRWTSLEHECATVYEGIKRFSMYLHGAKFFIVTDAEPLVWLRQMKSPKGKFATWQTELNVHDFDVIHRPGELNKVADLLSRLAHVLPEARPGRLIDAIESGDYAAIAAMQKHPPQVPVLCTAPAEHAGAQPKADTRPEVSVAAVMPSFAPEDLAESRAAEGPMATDDARIQPVDEPTSADADVAVDDDSDPADDARLGNEPAPVEFAEYLSAIRRRAKHPEGEFPALSHAASRGVRMPDGLVATAAEALRVVTAAASAQPAPATRRRAGPPAKVQASTAPADGSAPNDPTRLTGAGPSGSGAAYDENTWRRKRVTAVAFTHWGLLVHDYGDGIQLMSARKEHKKEALSEVAIRALTGATDGDEAAARRMVGINVWCLPGSDHTRHLLIPLLTAESVGHALGAVTHPGARWLDFSRLEQAVDKVLPWALATDGAIARRIQLLTLGFTDGSYVTEPHQFHMGLRAACDAALRQPMSAPVDVPMIATVQAAPSPSWQQALPELNDKARSVMAAGALQDGRRMPSTLLGAKPDVVAALQQLQEEIESGTSRRLTRSLHSAETDNMAVMGIDFEFCSVRQGPTVTLGLSIAQVAVGDHVWLFDVSGAPYLLEQADVDGVPSLAKWLHSPLVLKVAQSAASDCKLLADRRVYMSPLLDTACADAVIRGSHTHDKLDRLVLRYVGDHMVMKGDITPQMHRTLWSVRPLPEFAIVYCWQDVAWLYDLAIALRTRLHGLHDYPTLDLAYHLSSAPVTTHQVPHTRSLITELHLIVRDGGHVLTASAGQRQALPTAHFRDPGLDAATDGPQRLRAAIVHALLGTDDVAREMSKQLTHGMRAPLGKRRWVDGECFLEISFEGKLSRFELAMEENGVRWQHMSAAARTLEGAHAVALHRAFMRYLVESPGDAELTSGIFAVLHATPDQAHETQCAADTLAAMRRLAPQLAMINDRTRPTPDGTCKNGCCAPGGACEMVEGRDDEEERRAGDDFPSTSANGTPAAAAASTHTGNFRSDVGQGSRTPRRDLALGVRAYHDPSEIEGKQRGLELHPRVRGTWDRPTLRAVVVGEVKPESQWMSKTQCKYRLQTDPGHVIRSHPDFCSAMLANEDEHNNCVFSRIEIQFDPRDDSDTAYHVAEKRPRRSAVDDTLRGIDRGRRGLNALAGHVLALVQTRPEDARGRLTVDYGDEYQRDPGHSRGDTAPAARLTQHDVMHFLAEQGLSEEEAQRQLLLCCTPHDEHTWAHVRSLQNRYASIPIVYAAAVTADPTSEPLSIEGTEAASGPPVSAVEAADRSGRAPTSSASTEQAGSGMQAAGESRPPPPAPPAPPAGAPGGSGDGRDDNSEDARRQQVRDALAAGTPEAAGMWVLQFRSGDQPSAEITSSGLRANKGRRYTQLSYATSIIRELLLRLGSYSSKQYWAMLTRHEGYDVTAMCQGDPDSNTFTVMSVLVGFYHDRTHTYLSHLTVTRQSARRMGIALYLRGRQLDRLKQYIPYSEAVAQQWQRQGEPPLQWVSLSAPDAVGINRSFLERNGWQRGEGCLELIAQIQSDRPEMGDLANRPRHDETRLEPLHYMLLPPSPTPGTSAEMTDSDPARGDRDAPADDSNDRGTGGGNGGGSPPNPSAEDAEDVSMSEAPRDTRPSFVELGGLNWSSSEESDGDEGNSASNPIVIASVIPRAVPLEGALPPPTESECSFVKVVVHDGYRALLLQSAAREAMGGLNPTTTLVAAKCTGSVGGVYAARHAIRCRLGALWEYPALGVTPREVRLLGGTEVQRKGKKSKREPDPPVVSVVTAWYELRLPRSLPEVTPTLQRCFEERRATPSEAAKFTGITFKAASMLAPDEEGREDAEIVRKILSTARDKNLSAVVEDRVVVPLVLGSADIARHEPQYQTGYELPYEPKSFYDFDVNIKRMVATLRRLPEIPQEEQALDAEAPLTRTTRREMERLLALDRDRSRKLFADIEDDDDSDDEGNDLEDDPEGREALYSGSGFHPHAGNPAAYATHLLPSGLTGELESLLLAEQEEDGFCRSTRKAIQDYENLFSRVRPILRVEKGKTAHVSLILAVGEWSMGAQELAQTRKQRKRARRQYRNFHLSEAGIVYHIGKDTHGKACLQFVVPESCREKVIAAAHDGMFHHGRERTLSALVASRLWFPGMTEEVGEFIGKCPTCLFNKVPPHHGCMHIPPNGNAPWQVVCVDIVHLTKTSSGNSKAVLFGDRFGRGICAFPATENVDARAFINIVLFGLVPAKGVPLVMISDRGSNLIATIIQSFYEFLGIEPRILDAHMHTGVAMLERFNHTLREMARAGYFDGMVEWDLMLPHAILYYNSTVQKATKFSPNFVEHGRELVLPWHPSEVHPQIPTSLDEYIRDQIRGLPLVWEALMSNVESQEEARRLKHDSKYRTNVEFPPNSRVLLLMPGRVSKMELPYVGPYRVLWGPDERDRYALRDVYGRHNEFHVSKLKLWPLTDELGEDYWEITQVLNTREGASEREYYCKFKGWSKKHNQWIPFSDLSPLAQAEARQLDKRLQGAATHSAARSTPPPPPSQSTPAAATAQAAAHAADALAAEEAAGAARQALANKAAQQSEDREARLARRAAILEAAAEAKRAAAAAAAQAGETTRTKPAQPAAAL